MPESLEVQARRFADETSELLNATVAHGVRISSLTTPSGRTVMGAGVKKASPLPKPIPMAPTGGDPKVYLFLVHSYEMDPEGVYMAITSSTLSLYTSADMNDDELIVGIDYVRRPANQFPGSHLHVSGERDDLNSIYLGDDRQSRKLRDLHLPVGGKRFRPTLEDLIEFMVTEEMVVPRSTWKGAVERHRSAWERRQVMASARRDPESAAAALREAGWSVSRPE